MNPLFFHAWFFANSRRSWATVIALFLGLLIMAPLLPVLSGWLIHYDLLHPAILAAFFFPLSYILLYFVYQAHIKRIRAYLILVFIIISAIALTSPDRAMVEHIHVLVYALLTVFCYKTLSFYLKGLASYVVPLVVAVFVGVADETWQGMIPSRVFDFRDVSDNAVGALVGITFVYIRIRYGLDLPANSVSAKKNTSA